MEKEEMECEFGKESVRVLFAEESCIERFDRHTV